MCDCYSYNWGIGETSEVILNVPQNLKTVIKRDTVCIDACIVESILSLWDAGIVTHGACCGHNKIPASIILEDNVDKAVVNLAKTILTKPIEFYSWMDYDTVNISKV